MGRVIWKKEQTGARAQFVADVLKAALFDYSFDSYKVPSLNLRSFCEDYANTYHFVEEGVMQKGNLIPLNEEFSSIICESLFLPNGITDVLFQNKNSKGRWIDVRKDTSISNEEKENLFFQNAKYISLYLETNEGYLGALIDNIENVLNSASFGFVEMKELYYCLRELLTELIDIGVSKEYLYNRVQVKLFSKIESKDDIKYIVDFLNSLAQPIEEYSVAFGITNEVYSEVKGLLKGIRCATNEEQQKLKTNYIAEGLFEARDPYSALMIAKKSFLSVLNVYNSGKHDTNLSVLPNGLVREKNKQKKSFLNDSRNVMVKNKNKTMQERKEWVITIVDREVPESLFTAFELHNNALVTKDARTQLITLWTVFEMLIEMKQKNMSKVDYISNAVNSIMCNIYYERRINALYEQIRLTKGVDAIINQETRGNNTIEKLAYVIRDNADLKHKIQALLKSFPLENYMIEELAKVFETKETIKQDIERHRMRLRWQIMRIYRNRCLIVHDGQSSQYINSIIENLHYYVDEVLNYIFLRRKEGFINLETIFTYARMMDCQKAKCLEDKNTLTDSEFHMLVFNY